MDYSWRRPALLAVANPLSRCLHSLKPSLPAALPPKTEKVHDRWQPCSDYLFGSLNAHRLIPASPAWARASSTQLETGFNAASISLPVLVVLGLCVKLENSCFIEKRPRARREEEAWPRAHREFMTEPRIPQTLLLGQQVRWQLFRLYLHLHLTNVLPPSCFWFSLCPLLIYHHLRQQGLPSVIRTSES